jgi:hypothetical protein
MQLHFLRRFGSFVLNHAAVAGSTGRSAPWEVLVLPRMLWTWTRQATFRRALDPPVCLGGKKTPCL